MTIAHLNRVATAVPPFDVHRTFVDFADSLLDDPRHKALFARMVDRGQIARRYSPLRPRSAPLGFDAPPPVEAERFYRRGDFPRTGERMACYEQAAPELAARAVDGLALGEDAKRITHLVVTSCTGFRAPGVDLEIVRRCGLPDGVERTMVGFMGCHAGLVALKLARHIVRSEPSARVLVVAVELCTLHLRETADLEQILSFLLFGDGAAAALVTAEAEGFALEGFRTVLVPEDPGLITWEIRDHGFEMVLSGRVPGVLGRALAGHRSAILDDRAVEAVDHWAVHPGGRSVLDAVEAAFDLPEERLEPSRGVLCDYGNMSSATVLFVLARLLAAPRRTGRGIGLAFGPGLTAEVMHFSGVG